MTGQHDLGGSPAGPMDRNDPDAPPHGKLFTAINSALRQHDLVTIDELRRHLEGLSQKEYDLPYYDRWGEALCNLLEEKGVLARGEIESRMEIIKERLQNKND